MGVDDLDQERAGDRWGVPDNMFGPVPEDFYALVGRIVLVSALLEETLHDLFCALAGAPQREGTGESGTVLIKRIKAHVDRLTIEWREEAAGLLDDARCALDHRHEVVHSMWPHGRTEVVRGWRGDRKGSSAAGDNPVAWTSMRADGLSDVLAELLSAQRRCRGLLTLAAARA